MGIFRLLLGKMALRGWKGFLGSGGFEMGGVCEGVTLLAILEKRGCWLVKTFV